MLSDLLGACGQMIALPVPQSLHLYHEGVDSILMSLHTTVLTQFPLLSLNPRGPTQSPGGLTTLSDRQTDKQLG